MANPVDERGLTTSGKGLGTLADEATRVQERGGVNNCQAVIFAWYGIPTVRSRWGQY